MNPFLHGKIVTKADFCARPNLVSEIKDALEARSNLAIMGPRRTGKTSLVFEAARQIRGARLIYVHLWAVKSLEDVARKMVEAIFSMQGSQPALMEVAGRLLRHLRPRFEFDAATGLPLITLGSGSGQLSPSGLSGVFDLIGEVHRGPGGRVVIFLDEFQDIRRLAESDAVLGEMRGRIQQQQDIPYVFAGSLRHEMSQIFNVPSSAFFKSARVVEVGPIPQSAFKTFLAKRFIRGERTVSKEAYKRIFEVTDSIPSDVQQLCAAIWSTTEAGEAVHVPVVETALTHVLETTRKGFEPNGTGLTM